MPVEPPYPDLEGNLVVLDSISFESLSRDEAILESDSAFAHAWRRVKAAALQGAPEAVSAFNNSF